MPRQTIYYYKVYHTTVRNRSQGVLLFSDTWDMELLPEALTGWDLYLSFQMIWLYRAALSPGFLTNLLFFTCVLRNFRLWTMHVFDNHVQRQGYQPARCSLHPCSDCKPSRGREVCSVEEDLPKMELGPTQWMPQGYDLQRPPIVSGKGRLCRASTQKEHPPEPFFASHSSRTRICWPKSYWNIAGESFSHQSSPGTSEPIGKALQWSDRSIPLSGL
jgi:hypothetical protein